MKNGSPFQSLVAISVALAHLSTAVIGCAGPLPSAPEPRAEVVAAARRAQLAAPAFTPFQLLGPNDALRPSPYAFEVTPTGAATWNMPLWVPAGRNGMQPNISLSYHSKGGNGTLGLGFSVDGFSSIARCWSTLAQDGKFSSGTGGVPDQLCLDGQRLVPEGAPNEYRLEFDPGTRVRGTCLSGICTSFEVNYADGRTAKFGARDTGSNPSNSRLKAFALEIGATSPRTTTIGNSFKTDLLSESFAASETTLVWNIDLLEDRYGNFVEYDYDRTVDATIASGGAVEVVPREVRWTGHRLNGAVAIQPSRSLKFIYAATPKLDPRLGFQGGVALKNSKLLSRIEVYAAEGLVSDSVKSPRIFRSWTFGYVSAPSFTRVIDRLATITECVFSSAASSRCLDPVTFTWSGINNAAIPQYTSATDLNDLPLDFPVDLASNRPFYSSDVFDAAVGDFNGDGRDDLLYRLPKFVNGNFARTDPLDEMGAALPPIGTGRWFVRFGSAMGLSAKMVVPGLPETPGGDWRLSPRVVDLDSDGTAEVILYTEPVNGNPTVPIQYQAFGWNASTSDFSPRPSLQELVAFPAVLGQAPRRSFGVQLGDLDGDGRVDLVREQGSGLKTAGDPTSLKFRKGTATGFDAPVDFSSVNPTAGNNPIQTHLFDERYVVDVDGNGQPELITPIFDFPIDPTSISGSPFVFSALTSAGVPPGSSVVAQTTLHAMDLKRSEVMGLLNVSCTSWSSTDQFVRFFIDVNGDGLSDSVAVPSVTKDSCQTTQGSVNRTLTGEMFVSINTGAAFRRPATHRQLARNAFNPSVAITSGATPKSVDSGARMVDLDGDGRTDILLTSINENLPHLPTDTSGQRTSMIWLKSTPNGQTPFTAFPLAIDASPNTWEANVMFPSTPDRGGLGPRLNQVGDFNGDGFMDILSFRTDNAVFGGTVSARLIQNLQTPRAPDVVTAINGGPHIARVDFTFARGSIAEPGGVYTRGQCTWPQVCLKDLGWVVSKHTIEAANFESAVPERNVFTHAYEDARSDARGRGFLGVAKYTRQMFDDAATPALIAEDISEFDLQSKTCTVLDAQCTYTMTDLPARQSHRVPLGGGKQHLREVVRQRVLTSTGQRYRPLQFVAEINEREGVGSTIPLLRATRRMQQFDEYGTIIQNTTETSDTPLPIGGPLATLSTTWAADGSQIPNEAAWLINRYKKWKLTSVDESLVDPIQVRRYEVDHEPFAPELTVITREPNGPAETATTSGFTSTTSFLRNASGTVVRIIENGGGTGAACAGGSSLVRTTTIDFATNDADLIFPSKLTNPLCQSRETFVDSVFGLPQAVDDLNGVRTTLAFDALGRVRAIQPAGGATRVFTYASDLTTTITGSTRRRTVTACETSAAAGTSCAMTDPLGQVLRQTRDGFDLSVTRDFTFDRLGNLERESLPNSVLGIGYEVDALGRVLSRTRPGESASVPRFTTSFAYVGRTVERTDERGIKSSRSYDVKGRLVREATTDPSAQRDVATTIEYWHFDLPRRVVHPLLPAAQAMSPAPAALVTTMTWDVLGRRASLNDPDTGAVTTLYDALDQPKRVQDANGAITTTTFDKLGRPTLVETPSSTSYPSPNAKPWAQRSEFLYDGQNGIGALARATSTEGVETKFSFDEFGRPDAFEWKESGNTYPFSLTYDPNGRVNTLSYPPSNGKPFRLQYTYAPNGDIREIWDTSVVHGPGKKSPTKLWEQLAQNAAGQSTDEQFGASMRTRRSYDAAYQLRLVEGTFNATGARYQRLAYRWEGEGLLSQRTDLELGASETFTHDFLGRLKSWKVQQNCNTVEWTYGYDDWGNIRSRTPSVPSTALPERIYDYTVPSDSTRPHAVKRVTERVGATSLSSDMFTYDAAGQTTLGRGNAFRWAPFGLPRSIEDAKTLSTLSYDAFNQRLVKSETRPTGVTRLVTAGGLYELRTSTASMTGEHVYNVQSPAGLVAQVSRAVNPAAETTRFIHADSLGSPDTVTTEVGTGASRVGQLVERGKYDPFGERRHPWALATPIAQRHATTAGYTGHEPDDTFGLVNMRGRLYDARLGRFASPDPLVVGRLSQSANRYSYVGNAPTNRADPTGYAEVHLDCGKSYSAETGATEGCADVPAFVRDLDPRHIRPPSSSSSASSAPPNPTPNSMSDENGRAAEAFRNDPASLEGMVALVWGLGHAIVSPAKNPNGSRMTFSERHEAQRSTSNRAGLFGFGLGFNTSRYLTGATDVTVKQVEDETAGNALAIASALLSIVSIVGIAKQATSAMTAARLPKQPAGTTRLYRGTNSPGVQQVGKQYRGAPGSAPSGAAEFLTEAEAKAHAFANPPHPEAVSATTDLATSSGYGKHTVVYDVPTGVAENLPVGDPVLGEVVFKGSIPDIFRAGVINW